MQATLPVPPNAHATVQRPQTAVSAAGDPVVTWADVHSSVPVSLQHRREQVWDPTTRRSQAVAATVAYVPGSVTVEPGWRLLVDGRALHVRYSRITGSVGGTGFPPWRIRKLELVDEENLDGAG